jgi:hypothetical protein
MCEAGGMYKGHFEKAGNRQVGREIDQGQAVSRLLVVGGGLSGRAVERIDVASWRWYHTAMLRRLCFIYGLHGAISQKMAIFLTTT